MYEVDPKPHRKTLRPIYLRLIIIFVYTQVVVRTIDSTTTYRQDLGKRASSVDAFPVLTGIKVWRIVQLLLVLITYVYQLFKEND